MIYYDIVIWVMKLFRVYRIIIMMMIFNISTSYFSTKNCFTILRIILMMKLTLD
jgi:hypothetical protein